MEPLRIAAARSFTVRPQLPEALDALRELSHNLRWSYDRDTQRLFEQANPKDWAEGIRDPMRLLAQADISRLESLGRDRAYTSALAAATDSLEATSTLKGAALNLTSGTTDAVDTAGDQFGHLVAYFSPEFGITEAINQYSGGLGVLAGDHLKAAGELGIPLVAVGLFYRHGYFHQTLTVDGWQTERFEDVDPHTLALTEMEPRISVDLAGEVAQLRIWRAQLGPTPIYLLDADLPENSHEIRLVTDRLYGGDAEHRLRQEIVLGIGGVRALDALEEPADVFHTNEGHAGFMGLERIRMLMESGSLSVVEAFEAVRAGSVFTTHTPVPAGIDRFPRRLIERYFSEWARTVGLSIEELMAVGHEPHESAERPFNMAIMGMRLSQFHNGVSRAHGVTSRTMFASLWPGVPADEVPIGHVTNGVHPQTWLSTNMDALLESSLGPPTQWHRNSWTPVSQISDDDLEHAAGADRRHLVEVVRRRLRGGGLASGRSPSELAWTDSALDPTKLTICFARRMATHKRAALLLEQPDRLRELITDAPVQFVFAGKAHPGDEAGKEMIRRLVSFASEPAMRGRFVFVEDYDMALSRALVQGADVWLNTPLHPLEASGTSGMKAALNGALNLSVLDGWWAEAFDSGLSGRPAPADGQGSGRDDVPNGWAMAATDAARDDPTQEGPAPDHRAGLDSEALYELIENQVLPLWVERGSPRPWWDRVRRSLCTLGPLVDAHRMVEEYVERMYSPAAQTAGAMNADDHAGARMLAAFRRRVSLRWGAVRVAGVDTDESTGDLGSVRTVSASVLLGDLSPQEVEVQLLVGHLGPGGQLVDYEVSTMSLLGQGQPDEQGCLGYGATADLSIPGRMGLTVRVLPHNAQLFDPLDLGLVTWAS